MTLFNRLSPEDLEPVSPRRAVIHPINRIGELAPWIMKHDNT